MQGSSTLPKTPTMQGPPSHSQETPSISHLRLEDGTPAGTSKRTSNFRADRKGPLPNYSPQLANTHDKTHRDRPTMKRSAPTTENEQGSPSKRQKPLEPIAQMGASGLFNAALDLKFAQAAYERPLLKVSQLSLPENPGKRTNHRHEQGRKAVPAQQFHPRPSQSLDPFPDFQPQPPHPYAASMAKMASEELQKVLLAAANTNGSSAGQPSLPQAKMQPAQQSQEQPVLKKTVVENTAIQQQLRENQSSNLGDASANTTDSVDYTNHDLSSYGSYNNGDTETYLCNNDDLDRYFDDMEQNTNTNASSSFPHDPDSDLPAGWKEQQASTSPPELVNDSDTSKPDFKSTPERVYDSEIDDVEVSKAIHEAEDESKRRKALQDSGLAGATLPGNDLYGMGEEFADFLNYGSTANEAPEDDLIRSLFGDD